MSRRIEKKNVGIEPKARYISDLAVTVYCTVAMAYLFCVKQAGCRGRSLKTKQGAVHPSEKSIAVNGQPKCVRQTRQTGTPSHCRDWKQKLDQWTLHVRVVRHYLRH